MPEKIKITPEILLNAYCSGMFPMAETREDNNDLMWFSPERRALIPIDKFHAAKKLVRLVKRFKYPVTFNQAFNEVITSCANIRDESWINSEIKNLYSTLNNLGFAHSVEVWGEGELIGGLYGVAIGGAFFGESMFCKKTNASKIALVHLVARLKAAGFILLDAQFDNQHLHQFGMYELERENYLELLHQAIVKDVDFFDNYSPEGYSDSSSASSSISCSPSKSEGIFTVAEDSEGVASSINSSSAVEVLSFLHSITQTS